MGWNIMVAVVERVSPAQLGRLGLDVVGEPITGEEATASRFDGLAMSELGHDTVLLGNSLELNGHLDQLARACRSRVLAATFSSVTDTYIWNVDTPEGSRTLVSQEGSIIADEGAPLPEEFGVDVLDEKMLFDLLARTTGFAADDRWLSARWEPVVWPATLGTVARAPDPGPADSHATAPPSASPAAPPASAQPPQEPSAADSAGRRGWFRRR